MSIKKRINDLFLALFYFERRIDPYYRDTFDKIFRKPISAFVQALINVKRKDDHLQISEEKLLPNEKEITDSIIKQMSLFTHKHYEHRFALRAGNTKTYGVVKGEFEILPNLANNLRQGVFRYPKTYPAWVRFAGPGPVAPPDMKDNGILSIGIKLMDVEGDKLLDDEKWTQDFTDISLKMHPWSGRKSCHHFYQSQGYVYQFRDLIPGVNLFSPRTYHTTHGIA